MGQAQKTDLDLCWETQGYSDTAKVLSFYPICRKHEQAHTSFVHTFSLLFLPKAKAEVTSQNVTEVWQVWVSAYL